MPDFLATVADQLAGLRKLLEELTRDEPEGVKHETVSALHQQLQNLKNAASLPELVAVWQLAYALECLAKQLKEKRERVTPSTLRTVACGVDLLQELSRPGLKPDLCTNPPLRLLAVDDEPLSRHALTFALKKGVAAPDLAENGPAGLALAEAHEYDVIFLDVQMPGMNGFELCSKIRETARNAATPVVFVTLHSDFNARTQSTLSGGSDLLAKPFLTFEITVKALTLALFRRLQAASPSDFSPTGE